MSATTRSASVEYWEDRARRYATQGEGLAAVCSFGMPGFYNAAIHLCQSRALAPWLKVAPGTRVLDVGCGVGRWSRRLARSGATVTGVDLSATMVAEATRRARVEGLGARCRFVTGDAARLDVAGEFDLILAVTVLQHMPRAEDVRSALAAMLARLTPGGRIVLLEVAPGVDGRRTEHDHLRVHDLGWYQEVAHAVGLRMKTVTGVDLFPLKQLYLPVFGRLSRPVALMGLATITALSLPFEIALARRWLAASWHKVMVLEAVRT